MINYYQTNEANGTFCNIDFCFINPCNLCHRKLFYDSAYWNKGRYSLMSFDVSKCPWNFVKMRSNFTVDTCSFDGIIVCFHYASRMSWAFCKKVFWNTLINVRTLSVSKDKIKKTCVFVYILTITHIIGCFYLFYRENTMFANSLNSQGLHRSFSGSKIYILS